ncbi:MAG TPA: hypothetical protein VHB73_04045 [Alphaproteobacteria bacterium]|nr:hypothetical protein [Alphaproteobacteria bacterium]
MAAYQQVREESIMKKSSKTIKLQQKIVAGVRQGRDSAIQLAKKTNTSLVVWQDGKIKKVSPSMARLPVRKKK